MTLHLIKLCVGAESVGDLRNWIARRRTEAEKSGKAYEHIHTTRMAPKRREELLDGGSLYWVIKGTIEVRQKLIDVRPIKDEDGIGRCQLVLDLTLVPTMPRAMRPFQGWRYLEKAAAPADLAESGGADDLPDHLKRELATLGLL